MTIPYDPITHLPVLQAFHSTDREATTLAMVGCVTQEQNQNLTYLSKVLLQWHLSWDIVVSPWQNGWAVLAFLVPWASSLGETRSKFPSVLLANLGSRSGTQKEGQPPKRTLEECSKRTNWSLATWFLWTNLSHESRVESSVPGDLRSTAGNTREEQFIVMQPPVG